MTRQPMLRRPGGRLLRLPLCDATSVVLVRPHYPDNVGAAARAMKTMGMTRLVLVKPSRQAVPDHEQAQRRAVKSLDVLEGADVVDTLAEALGNVGYAFGTTSHRDTPGVVTPRAAAQRAQSLCAQGARIALVMGDEKFGLSADEMACCQGKIRIPMAADQPSVNLAQAVQVLAYEWFLAALEARGA